MFRAIAFVFITYLAFAPVSHQQLTQRVAGAPPVCNNDDSQKLCECTTSDRPKPEVQVGKNLAGQLCGKAISLPKPPYPDEAKKQKISGTVRIEIVIDEKGDVIWAKAIEGHPLLREASLKAACMSRHSPYQISGQGVKASGVISYNFSSK